MSLRSRPLTTIAAAAGILLLRPSARSLQVVFERVSDAPGGYANTHSLSGDGTRLIFASTGNHTGANADRNLELFVYTGGQIHQLTQTASQPNYMDNGSAQTNYDGTRVVFRSRFALHSSGAQLAGRDLFLARITYGAGASAPAVTFQRLTTTTEQGPFAFSGNGGVVVLATKSNLGGHNASGKPQLVKITLDPSVTFTRLTAAPTGIGDEVFDVAVAASYDGQQVAFHSDLDLDANNNPQGSRQIYRIMPNGAIGQLTDAPAGRRASEPAIADDGAIIFTSNGDLTGQNVDGNTEIFRIAGSGLGITQLTNTTAADDGFGGANDDVDISPDGSAIAFVSKGDLVPASGAAPGNADGNREIFLARYTVGSPPAFEQLTNTANPHPGTRIENVFPRTSNTGGKVAFNSDLDLGVPGAGILYVATVTATSPASPPVITSFTPAGGGPRLPVTIHGDFLATATQVRFGLIAAPSVQVLSNTRLVATVPSGVVDGTIRVTTPQGTAISAQAFRAASFVSFGEEFNQGVPQYPGVVGKDALVRVFSGTSVGGWMVDGAQLQVRMPSGAVVAIPPSMFSPILTNTVQEFSERSNVNFYVPGAVLSEVGSYDFTASVTTQGQVVHNRTISATLAPTKDVVMVFQSLIRHPDLEEWRRILRAFDIFSRIHPIRAGVGDLVGAIGADEPNAGLRVAYLNAPLWGHIADDPPDDMTCIPDDRCWTTMLLELESRLAIVNSGGFEATEFSTLFMPRDRLVSSRGVLTDCDNIALGLGAAGFGRFPGAAAWVQLCIIPGSTLAHEIGHNMGIVASGAPNSDGASHSSTGNLPERAFNVADRRDVPNPIPVMSAMARAPEDFTFFENAVGGGAADYPLLVGQRRLGAGGVSFREDADRRKSRGGDAPDADAAQEPVRAQPRFVFVASVDSAGRGSVHHAFTAPAGTRFTPQDSAGEYGLEFLDRSGNPLARARVSGVADRDPGERTDRKPSRVVIRTMQPLPSGTAAVVLRRGAAVVARVRPGARPPRVVVSPPRIARGKAGPVLTVAWRGVDADRDALVYHVELSRNGRTWVPISGAVRETSIRIPAEGLPGGSALRVRVTASDGLNTARAVSRTFRLAGHAPVVAIARPVSDVRYTPHDSIVAVGMAYDLEEGLLAGGAAAARFRWTVDGRAAGTGPAVRLRGLSAGQHVVVLTVTDAAGMRGADTVRLGVLEDFDRDGIPDVDELRRPGLDPGNLFDAGFAPDPRLGTWRDRLRRERYPRLRPRPR